VPALAGVPESQAKRDLERLGLEVKVDRRPDEVVPKGQVVRQDPPAETVLSGGDTVHVVVSQGPLIRSVPDLAGVAVEGAMFTLGRAGLALGTVSQADDAAVPTGAVIGTNPPAGTLIDRDSPVDVVVSNGPPPVAVPSVVGGTQTNAVDQLTRLGLVVGEVSAFGIPDDPAAGTVLEQLPPAGTLLRLGEVVTLTIRRAAIPTTTTAPPAPVPPTPGGG
ncbi:MAG: PASTA domain-containing protein, partial [Microthrixaceae bacterium]|nr:PASTA domain-containing protein [Microthrixaceae bacterium]